MGRFYRLDDQYEQIRADLMPDAAPRQPRPRPPENPRHVRRPR